MQADFAADRRRRRLVLTLGVLLGVVAAIATYFLITRPPSGTGPTATQAVRTIVVAASEIKAHTQIAAAMLTTQSVPDDPIFNGTASDPSEVIGNIALVDIPAGQPLEKTLYAAGNKSGVTILAPGETVGPDSPVWRAVSILVPNERAVGGMINAGDHVDLIVTLNPQLYDPTGGLVGLNDPGHAGPLQGQLYSDPTTKVTLTDIEVLATDPANTLYVLKVDEHQAEQIAHVQASSNNQFTLSLRPQADTRSFDPATYGQTTNSLIEIFGFKIPTMINVASPSPGALPSPTPVGSPAPSAAPTP